MAAVRCGMVITNRLYRDVSDLERMKHLLMEGRAAVPDRGYWHVGDLEWTAFGPHGFPLSAIFQLWEDGDELAGFVVLSSAKAFDYQVAPTQRGTVLEREMIAWGQRGVLEWRKANGLDAQCAVEAWINDDARITMLEELGYKATERGAVQFRRSLADATGAPRLPDGFEVRGLREADIDNRAITQNMAFAPGSKTTPATWRHMMANAPDYEADLDNIAVSPDGVTVAGALVWLDHANKVGEFEPVGTRPAFQRMGLGKGILMRGLAKMRERGMTTAIVSTNATNEPAIAAYASVGFEIRHRIVEYELVR